MAGRTPHEAYSNFIRPLQQAVSCVTDAVLVVRGGGFFPRDEPYVLNIGDATAVSVAGPHGTRFGLTIAQLRAIQHFLPISTTRRHLKVANDATQKLLQGDPPTWKVGARHIATFHTRTRTEVKVGRRNGTASPGMPVVSEDLFAIGGGEEGVCVGRRRNFPRPQGTRILHESVLLKPSRSTVRGRSDNRHD